MKGLPDSFEHADKVICKNTADSNAEYGKKYDILDFNSTSSEVRIKPGWHPIRFLSPYYDVSVGDILISKSNVYVDGLLVFPGREFEITHVHTSNRAQRVFIDTSDICKYSIENFLALHCNFRPLKKKTLKKKVKLI